jgi:eukaryotic-like serine/threonine-protein kinase
MLTKSGAKLLDFGLAKPTPSEGIPAAPTDLTSKGIVLGTLQYMAPEQVERKKADARTDIFAFGAVLYEMVTGRRAFQGESQASLIAAILEHEPAPISSLAGIAPMSLERIVKVCLAKDPDDRWQTARDLHRELKWFAESGTDRRGTQELRVARFSGFRLGALTLGVVLIAAWGAWYAARRVVPQTSPSVRRFVIDVRTPPLLASPVPLALAPDGSKLVYAAGSFESSQLYVRTLDQLDAKPLAGTLDARFAFFSPDGQWLGFGLVPGGLKKVPVTGGPVISVCPSCSVMAGASWSRDGMILFGDDLKGGLWKISADGGSPERVTALDTDKGEAAHLWPQALPNGRGVLFTIVMSAQAGSSRIVVQPTGPGGRRVVVEGGSFARYLPTGHLVYAQDGTLFAAKFDLNQLAITGPRLPVLEGLLMGPRGALYSFSEDGTLAFVPWAPRNQRSLVWVNRRGESEAITATRRGFRHPTLSPRRQTPGRGGFQRFVAVRTGDRCIQPHDIRRQFQFPGVDSRWKEGHLRERPRRKTRAPLAGRRREPASGAAARQRRLPGLVARVVVCRRTHACLHGVCKDKRSQRRHQSARPDKGPEGTTVHPHRRNGVGRKAISGWALHGVCFPGLKTVGSLRSAIPGSGCSASDLNRGGI